jgi:hypothetical protein
VTIVGGHFADSTNDLPARREAREGDGKKRAWLPEIVDVKNRESLTKRGKLKACRNPRRSAN